MRAEPVMVWDRIRRRDKTRRTMGLTPRGEGLLGLQHYLDPIIESVQDGGERDLPILAYYDTDRAVPDMSPRKRNFRRIFNRFAALDGAMDGRFPFQDIFEWFANQEDLERRAREEKRDFGLRLPVLESVRAAVSRVLPGCTNPRTELNPLRLLVDMDTPVGGAEQLALDQLSGGYRVMLTLVIDLARRMAQANPHRGKDAIDAAGVVLIDEIDLHLHPRWQQRVLHDLLRTFPNIQFIVTTHSPQVLTTVKPEQILILEREAGRMAIAAATSSYGAKSGRLLTEILGVDEQPPADVVEFTRLLNRYAALVATDRGEEPDALALRTQLDDLSPLEPELIRMDMEIRRRRVLRRTRGEHT
jgi:predicted ATP-binding protein involved in virulence